MGGEQIEETTPSEMSQTNHDIKLIDSGELGNNIHTNQNHEELKYYNLYALGNTNSINKLKLLIDTHLRYFHKYKYK
jgi:hypothetical protein